MIPQDDMRADSISSANGQFLALPTAGAANGVGAPLDINQSRQRETSYHSKRSNSIYNGQDSSTFMRQSMVLMADDGFDGE